VKYWLLTHSVLLSDHPSPAKARDLARAALMAMERPPTRDFETEAYRRMSREDWARRVDHNLDTMDFIRASE
jgi:hypothetical protein